jgi:hypothetical protein
MGMIAQCDLCKEAMSDEMDILEVKVYASGGRPKRVVGAMICDECQKALGLGAFLHKFSSMGGIDLMQRQAEQQLAEQRAAALNQPLEGPVPVDPKLAGRIRNAR